MTKDKEKYEIFDSIIEKGIEKADGFDEDDWVDILIVGIASAILLGSTKEEIIKMYLRDDNSEEMVEYMDSAYEIAVKALPLIRMVINYAFTEAEEPKEEPKFEVVN